MTTTGPAGRRGLLLLAVALAVTAVLGLVGWQAVGRNPSVQPAGFSNDLDLAVLADADAETALLVRGDSGRFVVSARNDSRVPVTLTAGDDPTAQLSTDVAFQRVDDRGLGYDPDGPTTASVRLGPGEVAAVLVTVEAGPCLEIAAGGAVGIDRVDLLVRTWGVRTHRSLPTALPVRVPGPRSAAPGC